MKTFFAALSTTALISVAPCALAASSTDLTVTGTITPSACTPNLSTGNIDYGKIPAKSLNQTEFTYLPEASLNLKVDCDATTAMAFRLIDNNPYQGSPFLSFGSTPTNVRIGLVMFEFTNNVADGVSVSMSRSGDNGQSWASTLYFQPNYLHTPTLPRDYYVPIPSQHYSTDLKVQGVIFRAEDLILTEEVPLNGNATIQVEYL